MDYETVNILIVIVLMTLIYKVVMIVAKMIVNHISESEDLHKTDAEPFIRDEVPVRTKSSAPTFKGSTSSYIRTKPRANASAGGSQIIIYAFKPFLSVCICSYCDGENNLNAQVCKICGRNI